MLVLRYLTTLRNTAIVATLYRFSLWYNPLTNFLTLGVSKFQRLKQCRNILAKSYIVCHSLCGSELNLYRTKFVMAFAMEGVSNGGWPKGPSIRGLVRVRMHLRNSWKRFSRWLLIYDFNILMLSHYFII